jgi:hypothetical protein
MLTDNRPEYIEPLREEIQAIIDHYGWTKDAVAKMVKLDSFMKECMRAYTLGGGEKHLFPL